MDDAEIRGRLLKHFYNLRHNNRGWVPLSNMIMSPDVVSRDVLDSVCDQLADVELIDWKPVRGGLGLIGGNAKIRGKGVAAVEAGQSADIDIRFPISNASTTASAPVISDDTPLSDAALSEIRAALSEILAEVPSLPLSNSAKTEITADINQIESETARPTPRPKLLKTFLESLRDNLAKAMANGLVALIAGLIAKYFHVF